MVWNFTFTGIVTTCNECDEVIFECIKNGNFLVVFPRRNTGTFRCGLKFKPTLMGVVVRIFTMG